MIAGVRARGDAFVARADRAVRPRHASSERSSSRRATVVDRRPTSRDAIDTAIERIEAFHRRATPAVRIARNGDRASRPAAAPRRHLRSRRTRGLHLDADHVRGAGADRRRARDRRRHDAVRRLARRAALRLQPPRHHARSIAAAARRASRRWRSARSRCERVDKIVGPGNRT